VRRTDLPDGLPDRPFTLAEARTAGLTRKVLRGKRFASTGRGTYVRSPTPDENVLVAGALLTLPPGTVAAGVTGLRLLGVMVGTADPLRFVTTHPHQVRRRGVRVTRVGVLPPHRGTVAIPEHCWVAAAADLDLVEQVTAGDWLLRAELTTLPRLQEVTEASRSRSAPAARTALRLVRTDVDSARESWLRVCLVLAGLPTPACNPVVQGDRRGGRVDLVYARYRVLVEYEGDQHRSDKRQWNRDIDRYEDFSRAGYVVVRITADRARYPHLVVRLVHEALVAGGYRGPEPVLDQRWMRLFAK
jgi:very-short-patch-repair endonuclease